ncbi:hypothetical protein A5649_16330 [Mycolicibacter heraklionensis]|uniref:Uncharacterized protein n=1 Tax=Mycolicibacter heraklionensis TaxID=512402 RepID=A0AA91IZ80_9MYCO|nr:hypothetical protein [Mycolicibacter heraklionensis]OBK88064.1 hypothetical protein A5649_16330 [Mycolicibacter heraklionensis]
MANEALDIAVTEFVAAVEGRNRLGKALKEARQSVAQPLTRDRDAVKQYTAALISVYEKLRPELEVSYGNIASSGAAVIGLTTNANIVSPVQALMDTAVAERAESNKMHTRLQRLADAGAGRLVVLWNLLPTLLRALPREQQIQKNLTDLTSYYLLEMMDDDTSGDGS